MSGLDISAAGMRDAQRRVDLAAHRIANVQTPGFQPGRTDSVEISAAGPGAVSATYGPAGMLEPTGLSGADAGALPMSNVDLAAESVNLLLAARAFIANLRALRAQMATLQEIPNSKR